MNHGRQGVTTTLSRKPDGRARRFANFWKEIEKNDEVLSVYGGSVLRIEKNGKVRRAGRRSVFPGGVCRAYEE